MHRYGHQPFRLTQVLEKEKNKGEIMKVAAKQINKAIKADVSDTVVFMAAYNIDKITKQFPQIWKKKKAKELLKSHHIAAIVSDNIVLTPNGRFSYTEEYDYVT